MRWKIASVVTTLLAASAVVARIELYRRDLVYGDDALTRLTLVAAALSAVACATIFHTWRTGHASGGSTGTDSATALAALIAVAVSLYSGLQLVFPNTPHQAAAAACRGVPLHNARALAQTTTLGVNARGGAGSAFDATDRFGPDCTIGVDGYCIGEPNTNSSTDLPDQRWLIVHHKDELVSGAYVRLQSPLRNLGIAPASDCPDYHGAIGPTRLTWRATAAANHRVILSATASGALLIGFAIEYTSAQAHGLYPYVNLGFYSPVPGFVSAADTATWKLAYTPALLHGRVTAVVAGEACYADDVPAPGTVQFRLLTFTNGVLIAAKSLGNDAAQAAGQVANPAALIHQACSLR